MIPKLANIDLKLLRVFMAIVEAGGFAAAQAQLNVSASRISVQIADLEARLGTRLCQRGRVGFRLTDKGRLVYEACQRLFAALDSFRAEVGSAGGPLVGELQLGIVDNTLSNADSRLARAIERFKGRDNDVHVTLHILAPTELERAVLDGRIQVAIGAFHHHAVGLAYEPLFAEEQTLYCGRGHPLFTQAPEAVSLTEVTAAEFADRGYMEGLRGKQLARFRATATAYHMEALALLVLSGRYIAYLPSHYAAGWTARGLMRPLLPRQLCYQSLFEVITRKGAHPTPAASAFLDDLRAAHRGLVAAAPLPAARRSRRRRTDALSRASAAS
ncbi:MAG TPA: LysR family transcriptional regulator [Dongiaceae bacterium]|jgi:LysR family transcriptional regulator, transcriptional activator for bauABCD operon|nr:LysR family transcriptional regulator [Dongiaceae bacterium]